MTTQAPTSASPSPFRSFPWSFLATSIHSCHVSGGRRLCSPRMRLLYIMKKTSASTGRAKILLLYVATFSLTCGMTSSQYELSKFDRSPVRSLMEFCSAKVGIHVARMEYTWYRPIDRFFMSSCVVVFHLSKGTTSNSTVLL